MAKTNKEPVGYAEYERFLEVLKRPVKPTDALILDELRAIRALLEKMADTPALRLSKTIGRIGDTLNRRGGMR